MDDLQALAAHLVTLTSPAKASGLPRFRWLPGMLAVDPSPGDWRMKDGTTPTRVDERVGHEREAEALDICGWLPDLSDPDTLGCLRALAREAQGDDSLTAIMDGDGTWRAVGRLDYAGAYGFTCEARVYVAVLEAAP